jgi:hypothetical protein
MYLISPVRIRIHVRHRNRLIILAMVCARRLDSKVDGKVDRQVLRVRNNPACAFQQTFRY